MAYPQPPEIATSYTAQEQALGNGTLPGQELDVDFASVRASVAETIDFVKGITRSDGKLANGIVTKESLASSLVIGFDPPEPWASGRAYTTSSTVFQGFGFYLCVTAHTSGVFATDFASGRWELLADLSPPGGALVAANNLSDLGDVANARVNLGLGSMATASASAYRTNVEQDLLFQPILTGLTASVAELNHTDGVTSPIQTQLNGKQASSPFLSQIAALGDPAFDKVLGWSESLNQYVFYELPGRDLRQSVTASASATMDFTFGFDNAVYRYYEFELENVKPTTDAVTLWLRLSTDAGATYDAGASDYAFVITSAWVGSAVTPNSSAGTTRIELTNPSSVGNAAGEQGVTGTVKLFTAGLVGVQPRVRFETQWDNTAGDVGSGQGNGVRRANQDTTAARFLMSSGTVASGTIRMYGIRG